MNSEINFTPTLLNQILGGVPQRKPTKKYLTKAQRQYRRKQQKLARRANRGLGKGEKRTSGK